MPSAERMREATAPDDGHSPQVKARVRVSVTVTVNTNPNPGQALIEKETVDFRELYKMVEKSHPELARAQMDKQMSMNS